MGGLVKVAAKSCFSGGKGVRRLGKGAEFSLSDIGLGKRHLCASVTLSIESRMKQLIPSQSNFQQTGIQPWTKLKDKGLT